MIHWFVENSLGLFPPVLEHRLRRTPCGECVSAMHHPECAVSYIQSIVPRGDSVVDAGGLTVRGYQTDRTRTAGIRFSAALDSTLGIADIRNTRITSFSCHAKTTLYLFICSSGRTSIYTCCFSGCSVLRDPRVPMHRLELFAPNGFHRVDKTPSCDLVLRSINLKGPLHYNWTLSRPSSSDAQPSAARICGQTYLLYHHSCVFCFRRFSSAASLAFHVNHIHLHYVCTDLGMEETAPDIPSITQHFSRNYRCRKAGPLPPLQHCTNKHSFDFTDTLAYLMNKNISDTHAGLMRRWNILRLGGNCLRADISAFIQQERADPSVLDFLLVLLHKSVLNPDEVVALIHSLQ